MLRWEWRTAQDRNYLPDLRHVELKALGLKSSNDWRGYLPDEISRMARNLSTARLVHQIVISAKIVPVVEEARQ